MVKKDNPQFRDMQSGKDSESRQSKDKGSGQLNIAIGKKQLFIIIGIVVVIILVAVSIPFYKNYIEPFEQTVITVDDTKINMRYFLERTRISGSDANSMLYTLTEELMISMAAPRYGIVVTEADIDQQLKLQAGEGDETISDIEYKEWLRQYLNTNQMSEKQLRELVKSSLLESRLEEYLAANLSKTARQVYLNMIVMQDYDEATAAVARIKAGESFGNVAQELTLDETTREAGGAYGWIVSELSIFDAYISRMEINQVSSPIPYYVSSGSTTSTDSTVEPDVYYILMVSEIDDDRELDDTSYAALQARVIEFWLPSEYEQHEISFNFDSELLAWINWQLQKNE